MSQNKKYIIHGEDEDGSLIAEEYDNSLEAEIQTFIDENEITIYHDEAIELFFEIRNNLIDSLNYVNSLTDKTKIKFINGIENKYIIPSQKQIIEDDIASNYSEFLPRVEIHPLLSSFEPFVYETNKKSEHDTTDALWAIADDIRARKEDGEFDTYRDAYRWAEKNITKKGFKITSKNLERAYHKAKSEGKVGLKKTSKVSIPLIITNKMRLQLSTLGYTRDEMRHLTPEQCWKIINKRVPKKPSRERGRNQ